MTMHIYSDPRIHSQFGNWKEKKSRCWPYGFLGGIRNRKKAEKLMGKIITTLSVDMLALSNFFIICVTRFLFVFHPSFSSMIVDTVHNDRDDATMLLCVFRLTISFAIHVFY